jgi:HEAT repeat protein
MPGGSQQTLQQLRQRLRELGQTPFVMWMLYFIVQKTGRVPSGAGSAFREFTQLYERRSKDDAPVSEESRRWWSRLLEHLAFEMMQADKPTDLRLTISKREAEEILTKVLDREKFDKPRDYALRWLEDLLKHHLIQVTSNDQIEFCHQLIQEYYVAGILLQMLLQKPSPVSDETLKREYLNYLKWTEPLARMLELAEDEAQVVRVVKLALEVDLRLGARLAGAVKPEFQQKTVSMIAGQEVPDWFKVFLLGETKSPQAADEFMKTIKHPDSSIRSKCVWASRKLGSEAAMPLIFRAIEDSDSHVRETAIRVIGELGSEQAIPLVSQILTKEPIASVREAAVMQVLGKLDSEAAILELLRATQDTEHNAREMAIHYLEEMSRELVIPVLTEALKNKNIDVYIRKSAAKLLGKLGDERIITDLFAAQLDVNIDVCHEAYYALHEIRIRARDKEISVTESQEVQRKQQIKMWLRYLNSEEPTQRGNAIYYLTNLLSKEEAVPLATQALNDQDHYVRGHGITSLVRLIGKEAVSLVVNALNDPDYDVRDKSAQELTGLGQNLPDSLEIPEETVSKLIKISNEEQNTYVRSVTIRTLTNLCSIKPSLILRDDLELAFLNASYSSDNFLRSTAAKGLGKFSSERASIRLLQMIEYDVSFAALSAIESLKNLPSIITAKHLPALRELILTATESFALDAIFTIQERCKFYNYTLTQAHQMEDKLKSDVNRDQVFISYSHKDKKWLEKLQTMLKPMMRNDTILVWDDTKIQAGAKWRNEIEKALTRANVAVLMVSANFLASDFIAKHELPPLLNAAEQEGLKIIWVPVGYCLYEETEIEQYQAVHNPSQPLGSLKGPKLEEALVKICRQIKAANTATT